MAKQNDWKDRLGVVFSTQSDYDYSYDDNEEQETLAPTQQQLVIYLDTKQRKGKAVTVIEGFVGSTTDLEILAKQLKTKCGVGGSTKEGLILLQGDWRNKVKEWLQKEGYKVKQR